MNTLLKLKDLQVNLQKIFQEALETPQKSPQEVRRHLLSQIIGAVQQVRDTILPIEAEIETIACSSEEPPTISGVTPTSLFEIEKLQKEIHEILLACTEIFAKDPNNLQALHEKLKNIQVIAEKLDEKL